MENTAYSWTLEIAPLNCGLQEVMQRSRNLPNSKSRTQAMDNIVNTNSIHIQYDRRGSLEIYVSLTR